MQPRLAADGHASPVRSACHARHPPDLILVDSCAEKHRCAGRRREQIGTAQTIGDEAAGKAEVIGGAESGVEVEVALATHPEQRLIEFEIVGERQVVVEVDLGLIEPLVLAERVRVVAPSVGRTAKAVVDRAVVGRFGNADVGESVALRPAERQQRDARALSVARDTGKKSVGFDPSAASIPVGLRATQAQVACPAPSRRVGPKQSRIGFDCCLARVKGAISNLGEGIGLRPKGIDRDVDGSGDRTLSIGRRCRAALHLYVGHRTAQVVEVEPEHAQIFGVVLGHAVDRHSHAALIEAAQAQARVADARSALARERDTRLRREQDRQVRRLGQRLQLRRRQVADRNRRLLDRASRSHDDFIARKRTRIEYDIDCLRLSALQGYLRLEHTEAYVRSAQPIRPSCPHVDPVDAVDIRRRSDDDPSVLDKYDRSAGKRRRAVGDSSRQGLGSRWTGEQQEGEKTQHRGAEG